MLIRFVLVILLLVFFLVGVPKLVQILLPFLFAALGATIIAPIANRINSLISRVNKDIRLPEKLTTFILNMVVLVLVSFILYFLASTLIKEVISIASSILQNWSGIVAQYDELLDAATQNAQLLPPFAIEILEDIKDSILVFVQALSKNIVSFTVSTTATGITSTGTFVINLITFFLALFFIGLNPGSVSATAQKYINPRIINSFVLLKDSALVAVGGYLKSQLILSSFAFLFMFVALRIYVQPYALTIALVLGLIDLLPVIGTIAILVPWGGLEFVIGDPSKGIYLVLVGLIFFLVRKVIEPKVMGDQTGLPPLLALLSTYIGLQLLGAWGAILGPLVTMLLISLARSGIFDNTFADLRAAFEHLADFMDNRE